MPMLPAIEQLLVLQDRDRKLRLLKQEQKNAPIERKGLDEKLASAQSNLDSVKLKAKEFEVERKKLETEAQSVRDKISKYNAQKFQTRKNEEFAALNHEIERSEKDVQSIEDRELDLMDAAEKHKSVIAEADKALAAIKSQHSRQIADIDSKIATINGQAGEVEAERAKIASEVDEDLLDTYNRLIQTKNGEAVVALRHDVCSGCHMKVTPTTSSHCRARKTVVQCENCARILYWED